MIRAGKCAFGVGRKIGMPNKYGGYHIWNLKY